MSALRVILASLLIGVAVCHCLPERSYSYPRSRCPSCDPDCPDCPEALAAQWNTPEDSSEQYSNPIVSQRRPYGLGSHSMYTRSLSASSPASSRPFYPPMRAERSPPSEEAETNRLRPYRGDLDHQPTMPHHQTQLLASPLTDKQLEEIVTRAILSAQRYVQNSLYRPAPFSPLHNPHLAMQHNERPFGRDPEMYEMSEDEAMRQQLRNAKRPEPRDKLSVGGDPYIVYEGSTDDWDRTNWQSLGKATEGNQEIIVPKDFKAVKKVNSDKVEKNIEGKMGDIQEEGIVDPALVNDMEVPPTEENSGETDAKTPYTT